MTDRDTKPIRETFEGEARPATRAPIDGRQFRDIPAPGHILGNKPTVREINETRRPSDERKP